ncbi:hypothetical protein MMC13_001818 [Lambiella insularis]|nr:hypothetical protein [Lambiella insularis]
MGCDRKVLKAGNGVNVPKKGDTVIIEYTGYLYDGSKSTNDCRGVEFDSSKNHGDEGFETAIGLNRVIKGWEVGVLEMSVGERSILTISSDYAYGDLYAFHTSLSMTIERADCLSPLSNLQRLPRSYSAQFRPSLVSATHFLLLEATLQDTCSPKRDE